MPSYVRDVLAAREADQAHQQSATMSQLVGCLVALDRLPEAKAAMSLQTRGEVRRMLATAVEAWVAEQDAVKQRHQAALQSNQHRRGLQVAALGHTSSSSSGRDVPAASGSGKDTEGLCPPAVQSATVQLLNIVFDQCLRALANLGGLLAAVAAAGPCTTQKMALHLLNSSGAAGAAAAGAPGAGSGSGGVGGSGGPGGGASSSSGPSLATSSRSPQLDALRALEGGAWARAALAQVVQGVQEEVAGLLGELLGAPLRARHAPSGPPSSRWVLGSSGEEGMG
jgi:hypothetical protein